MKKEKKYFYRMMNLKNYKLPNKTKKNSFQKLNNNCSNSKKSKQMDQWNKKGQREKKKFAKNMKLPF